ncbi:hypothetical protein B7C42_05279 [Nocardia cerradoensis]|uniref:PASTA domain-containing protein n=1 Tax=Nocardia cerradoensis TaxID=85688 RepID=A0A231H0Y1_9NOCA|nr:PASTA domain-containing protein [Nocardia cerradoensis]OXR42503.1 hypothetical protein B7C42_05279 [Nocardia cerradoensis]
MRRIAFAASLLTVVCTAGACGASSDDHAASTATTSAAAQSSSVATAGGQDCGAQPWPRPLPDFSGKPLGQTVVGAALCFDITGITTADGRDVMHDPGAATTPWTVTAQQPAAGTPVAADTAVTLTVDVPH